MQRIVGTDRVQYLARVQEMLGIAYADIGLPSSQDLLAKYPVWLITADMTACWLSKETTFGTKMCMCGHDGSVVGKKNAVSALKLFGRMTGFYAEVSGKIETSARTMDLPMVSVEHIPLILGKPIVALDAFHYRREITGLGQVVKVMIGTPKL